MKAIIIFYSFSGNTKLVAQELEFYLKEKNFTTEVIELKPVDESKKFFTQASQAFIHKKAKLKEVNYNLDDYDIACFGTPVWAFAPAPALNTYLDRVSCLENKKVVLFVTFGSGLGVNKCLQYIKKILRRKGVKDITNFSIQQEKVFNKEFVLAQIKKAFNSFET
ncbi:MAG: NAD(P)H-dependent oxidoreductase [Candidatus Omnitrophica bacterium]|nr:NAD(P)H-dependent oxidoreductase [Candidatus Omnitrophota bacterium]MCM8831871.1 NAD(P)H-dependent oxidoreductase [Candidatus Omnitrophota bacterium]